MRLWLIHATCIGYFVGITDGIGKAVTFINSTTWIQTNKWLGFSYLLLPSFSS